MKILKVDKDKAQVELTREELCLIEGGLFLAQTYEIKGRLVSEEPQKHEAALIELHHEWRKLRASLD